MSGAALSWKEMPSKASSAGALLKALRDVLAASTQASLTGWLTATVPTTRCVSR